MKKVDQRMLELAAAQYGVITRADFLEFGSRDQLKRRLQSGQYIREYEGVYSVAGSPSSYLKDLYAGVATRTPLAAGAFLAAANMHGLPGGEELDEVTFLRHNRVHDERIKAHESVNLDAQDLMVVQNIQVTRVARTLCDLAGLEDALDRVQATWDMTIYSGTRHGFTNPGAGAYGVENIQYNARADKESWAAMMVVLDEVFAGN
jgi:hypothetical protein